MELLKKHTNLWTIILFVLFPISLFGQDEVIKAFRENYVLEKSGNYIKAIDQIKAVYQADSYEMNLRLGWLNYLGGQFNESIGFYSKAISLKPYAIEARFGMTYPASAQGKWEEVIDLYNKILAIDPQNTIANYRLGLIYYGRENYEKADGFIEKVVNLYPFDYDSVLLLAWNKLKLQKTRESKVLFNKVLMYSPDDKSALEGLKLIK
ncbi:tetratricopeptide repeat protein [bacterium]|nr:MAG: tetratricopeptide repeat protein [bacterium]